MYGLATFGIMFGLVRHGQCGTHALGFYVLSFKTFFIQKNVLNFYFVSLYVDD